jgi:uncharacterized protein (TIRG00374 family)
MRSARRYLLLLIALATTLAVPLLLGGRDALGALATLSLASLAVMLGVTVFGWLARAAKLWLLARRVDIVLRPRTALAVSLATDCAFLATPVGLGGYAANVLLLRRAGASTAAATAVAATDQIADAMFFAFALPIAALCALGSAAPDALLRAAFVSGSLLLAGALIAFSLRRRVARWLLRYTGSPRRGPRIVALHEICVRSLHEVARLLRGDPYEGLAVIALTSVQWTTRYGVLWLALDAFGHRVPYAVTLLAQGLVMHAAQWTGIPAGAGGAEFGLAAALAPWVSTATLAPAVLVWRGATLYLPLLAGGCALLGLLRAAPVEQTAYPALGEGAA